MRCPTVRSHAASLTALALATGGVAICSPAASRAGIREAWRDPKRNAGTLPGDLREAPGPTAQVFLRLADTAVLRLRREHDVAGWRRRRVSTRLPTRRRSDPRSRREHDRGNRYVKHSRRKQPGRTRRALGSRLDGAAPQVVLRRDAPEGRRRARTGSGSPVS